MSEDSGAVTVRIYEAALAQFRAAGMPEDRARAAARDAAVGRDGGHAAAELREALTAREALGSGPQEGFDRLVESLRRLGLSPEAARSGAIGQNRTERQAREAWRAPAPAATAGAVQLEESARAGLPRKLVEVVELVAQRACERLHKTPAEARRFALDLCERERRRFGDDFAADSMQAFAAGLAGTSVQRTTLREVPQWS